MAGAPGEKFGEDLVLIERLAAGGMAEVYRARQTGIGGFEKMVAVKRILPNLAQDDHFKEMFQVEVNLSARFQHPNIVQVFRTGELAGWLYLVMEFVHGKSLSQLLRALITAHRPLPVPIACHIACEAAKGLDYAHGFKDEQGRSMAVIHRDISPQNIMISYDSQVKLVDFGIAKAAGRADMTAAGVIKGKASYMSPEQAKGEELDQRTDVFSLGIILHEMLTEQRLFKADTQLETRRRVIECAVRRPSSINLNVLPELDRICMRALEPNKDARYSTCRELYRDLLRYLQHAHTEFVPTDAEDFVRSVLSAELSADEKRQKDLSADLPTTISQTPIDRPSGAMKTPPMRTKTGEALWTGSGVHRTPSIIPRPAPKRSASKLFGVIAALVIASAGAFFALSHEGPIKAVLPSSVVGLVGWWHADVLTVDHGTEVESWRDSSPHAFDLAQENLKLRPKYSRAMLNGLPAIAFDGVDDYMTADKVALALRSSKGATVIIVARAHTDRTQYLWSMHASDRVTDVARMGFALGEKLRVKANAAHGAKNSDSKSMPVYGFSVYTTILGKADVRLYVDGTKQIEDTADFPINWADATYFSVGMEWDEHPGDFFEGEIAELLVYDRQLDDRERKSIEVYLLKKYGIVVY